jgi:hypothetical protein
MRSGVLREARLSLRPSCVGRIRPDDLLPTPAAREPGWKHLDVRTVTGAIPTHPQQRWYADGLRKGEPVQKGVAQCIYLWPGPSGHAVEPGRYASPAELNPSWVEWLMGYREGWTVYV